MKYLFTYGTLRNGVNATHALHNFRLCYAKGKTFDFPYVVPEKGAITYGNLVGPIRKKDWSTLDRYENVESGLYVRQLQSVAPIGDGDPVECAVYIAGNVDYGEGHRLYIETGDWYKRLLVNFPQT